jgi:imidazole glycerol phosphate synthase subunit HisF
VDARRETGYGLSPDFMEIVTKNDPKFVRAYLMMSVASSLNAGKPERTIEIMNKGLSKITPDVTDAYFLWLYKGVDELLFLGDIPAAKKSNQMAADWAKIAGNEFIEKSARGTVKFLETNPDSRAPRVGAWMLVWINSQDEETRKLAKENIEKLGGKLIVVNDNQVMAIPPKD